MEFIKLPKVMSNKQAIPNFGITSEKWVYYDALIGDNTSYMIHLSTETRQHLFLTAETLTVGGSTYQKSHALFWVGKR